MKNIKSKFKSSIKPLNVGKQLSQEQDMMNEMFGGRNSVLFGSEDSESLPQMNGAIITGEGLIKNGDEGRTGYMFGM